MISAPVPSSPTLRLAFLSSALLLILSSLPPSSARLNPDWNSPSRWKLNFTLEYYVHAHLGDLDIGSFLPAIHPGLTVDFGSTQLFSFNATQGADPKSMRLGSVRGYIVQSSYVATVRGMEVESLSYNDGSLNGTIQLRGLIAAGGSKIAVLGGTDDFRGVKGYGNVTQISSAGNIVLYHHQLHFV